MKIEEIIKIAKDNGSEINISQLAIQKTVLWGVAPTGDIHIGYLPYIAFIRKLKELGYKIILFIGDYHGYWDSEKTNFEEIKQRTVYYSDTFKKFGFDDTDIYYAKNTYTNKNYIELLFKFSNLLPSNSLVKFADKTLQNYHTKEYSFADLIYVATQIIDIVYFNLDMVICGLDEAGIYKLGLPIVEPHLDKAISYAYLNIVPGVESIEMHASDNYENKISVHDSTKSIEYKLNKSNELFRSVKDYILPLFGYTNQQDKKQVSQILHNICNGKY